MTANGNDVDLGNTSQVQRDIDIALKTPIVGYFLMVELLVLKKNVGGFERAVTAFLREGRRFPFQPFKRLDPACDVELVLALKSPKPFDIRERPVALPRFNEKTSGRLADKVSMVRYLHMWMVPNLYATNLTRTMQRSADDRFYIDIDNHVARETQEFVYQVQWPTSQGGGPRPLSFARRRATRGVAVSTRQYASANLGTYLFKLGTQFPTLTANGCESMGTFQSVTGSLDTVIQFWETTGAAPQALKVLGRAQSNVPQGLSFTSTKIGPAVRPVSERSEAFGLAPYSP